MESAGGAEVHVRDYSAVLWKRKWPALIAFAAIVVPVFVHINWIQSPRYESTAALMVKIQGQQAELFGRAVLTTKIDVDTEIEVMKSPPVLARPAQIIEAGGLEPLYWLQKIEWNRIEETPVVHITAESPSPELSRDIANSVGQAYIDYSRRAMLDTSRSAFVWMERQLAEAEARMQRDEQKLQDFRKAHPDANLEVHTEFNNEYHHALTTEAMEVQLASVAAETQLDEYGKLLDQSGVPRPGLPDEEPKVISFDDKGSPERLALLAALSNSERLAGISAGIDSAKAALTEKLKKLKSRHPEIMVLEEQLSTLQSYYQAAFLTECQKGYIERRAHLAGMQAMLREKTRELSDYRRQFFRTTDEQLQYSILQRNVEASRMLYSTVLSRLKEFDLSQGAAAESARFIQPAPAGLLKDPQNGIKLAFAVLCGVLLSVGAALSMEYFDTTLKSPADVERALDLAVLGTVPQSVHGPLSVREEETDLLIVVD